MANRLNHETPITDRREDTQLDPQVVISSRTKPMSRLLKHLARSTDTKTGRAVISLVAVCILVLIWAGVSRIISQPLTLPTPTAVAKQFAALLVPDSGNRSLWPDLTASLLRVLAGWFIGLLLGVSLGVFVASNKYIRAAIDPIIEAGRAVPPLAFAPLMLVWFGVGETSKVLLLVAGTLPVFAVATVSAIAGIDPLLLKAGKTLGASRKYATLHIVIPSVLPDLFTAMRVATAFAWSTLVAAELVAADKGLGWMILRAGRYLDTATVFVGIIVIGVLAFLFDRCIRLAERVCVPWKGKGE